ncbi:endonuclease III [Candidatus Omnitrophota bacterium]
MRPAKVRIPVIIKILRKTYPQSSTALFYKTPFQIMIATILSAQCTDERVNKITPSLFKKYKDVYDFARVKAPSLEKEIHSAGFYRNKARNIIASSKKIVKDFNGKVPSSMKELVSLPGVARKTANIVLSSGFKKTEGIAVDTHVKRLSGRLGLSKENIPEKIEKDLMEIVPREDWIDFNYMLVEHGRKTCKARKPLCPDCAINKFCPKIGI